MAQHLDEIPALVQKAFALPDLPDSLLRGTPVSLHDRVHPSHHGKHDHTPSLAHFTGPRQLDHERTQRITTPSV